MVLEGAEVHTADGKKIGNVLYKDDDILVVVNKGLLTNEEFRIPTNSIISYEIGKDPTNIVVRISLDKEKLKHGVEFLRGKPNSDFISGKLESEPILPTEKQVIRYETIIQPDDSHESASTKNLDAYNSNYNTENKPSEYACDMCPEKFENSENLHSHKSEFHKMATDI